MRQGIARALRSLANWFDPGGQLVSTVYNCHIPSRADREQARLRLADAYRRAEAAGKTGDGHAE